MESHPWLRRVVLWAGPVLAIATLVDYFWFVRSFASIATGLGVGVGVGGGAVFVGGGPEFTSDPSWMTARVGTFNGDYPLWFDWGSEPEHWWIAIPLWFVALVACALSLHVWRADARARRKALTDACVACGYSRAGLAGDAPCPECGRAVTRGASSTP